MSLRIVDALKTGANRLVSRAGAAVTVGYLLLYAVYQAGYNVLLNALYVRLGVAATVVEPIPLPVPVAAAIVAGCLFGLTYVSVVAIRTFVAGERDAIPRSFLTDGVGWAVLNLFVGGVVTMLLFAVGFVLLVVPGLFLLVSFAFMAMYVAVDGENFVTGLRRSWGLARGDRLRIFGLVAVVALLGFAVGAGFGVLSTVATLAGVEAVIPLAIALVTAPVTMYNLAVLAAAFEQLRGSPAAEPAI
ncbi:MAG: hypothetical protein ABEJ73_04755 [Haloplanus sp.]